MHHSNCEFISESILTKSWFIEPRSQPGLELTGQKLILTLPASSSRKESCLRPHRAPGNKAPGGRRTPEAKIARMHAPTTTPNIVTVSCLVLLENVLHPPSTPIASARLSNDPVGTPRALAVVHKRRRATRSWIVSRRDVFEVILSVSGESGGAGWRKSRESQSS